MVVKHDGTREEFSRKKLLGGLLKAIPQGLIRGAAQRLIADVWARVAAELERDPPE